MFGTAGILNGAGQTMSPKILTLISLWAARVPLAWYVSRFTLLHAQGNCLATAAGFVVTATISYLDYFSGRWKKATAKIQMSAEKTLHPAVMEGSVRARFGVRPFAAALVRPLSVLRL